DAHEGGRNLTLRVFYPAAIRERSATPFHLPFFAKLNLYKDAEAADGDKHPLVVFSHGRGSNGLYYAWFAEFLASHGYIVAALNHYHLRLNHRLSREQALATPARRRAWHQLPAERSGLGQVDRRGADRGRRPFARRLHGALGGRRAGQSRKVSGLPTRLAQQSDGAGISAQRAAARRAAGARRARPARQGRVGDGARHRAGLRHG